MRDEQLTEHEKNQAKELENILQAHVDKISVTVLEMSGEAKQAYDAFEEQIEQQITEEKLNIKEGYSGQLPNLVVRLSCLYRISRMKPEEIKNCGAAVKVEVQDVERAIEYASRAWDWFEQVIAIMQSGNDSKPLPKESAKKATVEFLSDGVERNVNEIKDYVIRRTGVCQATFYNALKELRSEEKVARVTARPDYYMIVKEEKDKTEGEKK